MKWLPIAVCVCANICANLALKRGVLSVGDDWGWPKVLNLVFVPWLWLGITCLAVVFASYLVAIRHMSVGLAYPLVTSLVTVGTAMFGTILLEEHIEPRAMFGIVAILVGVFAISTA